MAAQKPNQWTTLISQVSNELTLPESTIRDTITHKGDIIKLRFFRHACLICRCITELNSSMAEMLYHTTMDYEAVSLCGNVELPTLCSEHKNIESNSAQNLF